MRMPYLQDYYESKLKGDLRKNLSLKNVMQVPRLEKIVLNMGVGRAVQDSKALQAAQEDLTLIAGQHAVVRRAKKSVAGFKIREGVGVGVSVTLRKARMYEFLERFLVMALPRVRNYQGASSKSFDGKGNYALGIPEHTVFYEVDYNKVSYAMGLDVVLVTTSSCDQEAFHLLKGLGMPFKGGTRGEL